jgi:hypothetical protein
MAQARWAKLVSDVLLEETARTGRPVPGAKLRTLLAKRAALEGLAIPDSEPFSGFLVSVAPNVVIMRQRGSDMLVLPPERPELLPAAPNFHIRKDLFEAFTTISTSASPWYDREKDRVFWRRDENGPLSGAVPIPGATSESALEARRAFTQQLESSAAKQELEDALEDALPLRAFSRVAVRHRVLQRWQAFRSQDVRARLESWARHNGIAWRDAWLVPRHGGPAFSNASSKAAATPDDRAVLLSALAYLDSDELRRIQVPLDLVAKMLSHH